MVSAAFAVLSAFGPQLRAHAFIAVRSKWTVAVAGAEIAWSTTTWSAAGASAGSLTLAVVVAPSLVASAA
jgi:hypothetical protein